MHRAGAALPARTSVGRPPLAVASRPSARPVAAALGAAALASSFDRVAGPQRARMLRLGASFVQAARPLPLGNLRLGTRETTSRTVQGAAAPNLAIPDLGRVESSIAIPDSLKLTSGKVKVEIPHTYVGDLVVTLTSPSGKKVTLQDRKGGSAANLMAEFDLAAFAGEDTRGAWKLGVEDKASRDVGRLARWSLALTGTTAARPPEPPPSQQPVTVEARPGLRIDDRQTVYTQTLEVKEDFALDSLELALDLSHRRKGDVRVVLTSPSGKSVVVHDRTGGSDDDVKGRFPLDAFKGDRSRGAWTLRIEDEVKGGFGKLNQWGLTLRPSGTPTPVEPPRPPEPPTPIDPNDPFGDLRDEALLGAIRRASAGKQVLSYSQAREAIYRQLDVHQGRVRCVYTGRDVPGGSVPNNSVMNVEHTWPQSKGATGDAKSDLHHLFPTDSQANGRRGSFPFGNVVTVQWSQGGSKLGLDSRGRQVFEPPDAHKGNVARALFYFSAEYDKRIPDDEEAVLRQWHRLDAVDAAERARNAAIKQLQGNSNKFIEHSQLVDRVRDF